MFMIVNSGTSVLPGDTERERDCTVYRQCVQCVQCVQCTPGRSVSVSPGLESGA